MSIPMDAACYQCHMRRNLETARQHGSEETATAFAKDLMRLYLSLPEKCSSPEMAPQVNALLKKYYNLDPDRLKEEKFASNAFVMARLDKIRDLIASAPDPVYGALQAAVLGNYLDFAALQGKVDFQQLDQMLEQALQLELDRDCYRRLCDDLQKGSRVLILTDNAGEIAIDRLLAETLQAHYPHLQITFCVRGGPVYNDATREDARDVGISFPVIDSGVAIGGTAIHMLCEDALQALQSADVIIAKGMGNTETLYGCGYNVYYAFLVKCARLSSYFHQPLMTPMLVHDA
jgi:uncharacterized protein with ATP-grasp and redox domains